MKNTTHYNLKKPESADYYNIDDQNTNMDIIDTEISNKVDKIDGKGLSTEDFTTIEKNKLAQIYDWATGLFSLKSHNHDTVYEKTITKKSGFNLEKSDSVSSSSSSILATLNAVKKAYDKAVSAYNLASSKLGVTAKASDSDKLDGKDSTAFASSGHDHDTKYSNISHHHNGQYLLKSEKAIDSDKLDGKNSTDFANSNHNHDSRYEQIISKNSGFNLDKSDSVTNTSTSILATVKAVKTAYDKAVSALNIANSKLEKNYGDVLTTSTSFTLNSSYKNRVVLANSPSNRIITIPSGIFEKGTQITIIRAGTGTVTLSTSGGMALYSAENKRSIKNQYGSATIVFSSGSVAYLIGSLE